MHGPGRTTVELGNDLGVVVGQVALRAHGGVQREVPLHRLDVGRVVQRALAVLGEELTNAGHPEGHRHQWGDGSLTASEREAELVLGLVGDQLGVLEELVV